MHNMLRVSATVAKAALLVLMTVDVANAQLRLSPGEVEFASSENDIESALARVFAPILWFSHDEALRLGGVTVPEILPCDMNASRDHVGAPIVYYFVRPNVDEPVTQRLSMTTLDVRYLFYYSEDSGSGRHLNDLESATFTIELAPHSSSSAMRVARLIEVQGAAHGSAFYANRLRVRRSGILGVRDLVYPVTLLVEENKHAVSPDRNGDGAFTPGYDVNANVVDAWGVRDSFGSGWLGSLSYQAYMTKPRVLADRIMPPGIPQGVGAEATVPNTRYSLRRLPAGCMDQSTVDDADRAFEEAHKDCMCRIMSLSALLQSKGALQRSNLHRFLSSFNQFTFMTLAEPGARYYGASQVFSLGSSLVGGKFGTEVRLLPGHSGPNDTNAVMRLDVLGFFTPSLTRAVDWYIAAGLGSRFFKEFARNPVVERSRIVVQPTALTETGLWFRWASRLSFRVGVNVDAEKETRLMMSLSVDPAAHPDR